MSSLTNQPTPDSGPDAGAAAHVERLYASYSALVRSVCRSLLRDHEEAEDAVQQTFLAAQRALMKGSAPRDAAAWLATIARHESFARVRTRMREPLPAEPEPEPSGPDAHAIAVNRHDARALRAALAELPAQQREALLLREVRGFSYEEVASTLSVTTPAVESLLFRARRNLQVRLRDALAAYSPLGLARELAARLAGGFAAPAAAKALAVGVGAAVVAGGAIVGPHMINLGHVPPKRPTARARRLKQDSQARMTLAATGSFSRARLEGTPSASDATRHEAGDHSSGGDEASPGRASSDGGSDLATTPDSGSSSSNGAAEASGGGTNSGSDSTTTDPNSQSTPESTTQPTTTSSGSPDSSGSSTSSSFSGSDSSGATTTTGSTDGG
jgi:RNA polymerase sigma-70 factor (ECF subfamily)